MRLHGKKLQNATNCRCKVQIASAHCTLDFLLFDQSINQSINRRCINSQIDNSLLQFLVKDRVKVTFISFYYAVLFKQKIKQKKRSLSV